MIFEHTAAEGVGARPGGHVDHATRKPPEFGAAVVGLHPKFFDRVWAGRQHHDVAVGSVLHRYAIEERCALVSHSTANLVVAGSKNILAGQAAFAPSLRYDRRRKRNQIQHVPSVQRQVLHRPAADDRAD